MPVAGNRPGKVNQSICVRKKSGCGRSRSPDRPGRGKAAKDCASTSSKGTGVGAGDCLHRAENACRQRAGEKFAVGCGTRHRGTCHRRKMGLVSCQKKALLPGGGVGAKSWEGSAKKGLKRSTILLYCIAGIQCAEIVIFNREYSNILL